LLTPTHLVTAQAAYLAACIATAHPPAPAEAIAALGAGLIPDLDSRQSYAGRLVPPLSGWIEHRFGHRAVTHSLLAQALIGALAWALLPFGYFLALAAGWVSHTMADMMTPSGVAWFWPARGRCVLPANPHYRMEVMGKGELGFLIVMAVLGLLLMPLARTGEGTTGLIRSAIGDMTTARAEYDAGKGSHAFALDLRGRDNRTYADVSGTYPVIGPYREAGFILGTEQGPRSACRSGACDWYAEHAVLIRGEAEQTTTFAVRVERTSAEALLASLAPLQEKGKIYLLGTLTALASRPAPPTVDVAADTVTLNYAVPGMLETWKGRTLRDLDLAVQVRHAPGTEVAQPQPPSREGTGVHPLLEKWMRAGASGNH
jgi:inner membrane protein